MLAMQGQLDEMRLDQRPWLRATPKIVGPLYSKGGMLSMVVEITVSNSGHTPAGGGIGGAMITSHGHRIVTGGDIKKFAQDLLVLRLTWIPRLILYFQIKPIL